MRSSLARLPVIAGLGLVACVGHPVVAPPPTAFVVRGANVFDGDKNLGALDVLVRGARIAAIGPRLAVPKGASIVDGRGRTLLPGLIDAHTHSDSASLRTAVIFGSTTQLDQFSDIAFTQRIQSRQVRGELDDLADVRSAGTLVTAPQGHGTEYFRTMPTISSPDSAQAFVDARIAEGSQWIKLVYDDERTVGRVMPTLSVATLRAVISAAHARRKLAVVHVLTLAAAKAAIEAGADGLMHLFVDQAPDTTFVQLAVTRAVFVVPTLSVLQSLAGRSAGATLTTDANLEPWLSAAAKRNLSRHYADSVSRHVTYEHAVSAIRLLRRANVVLLAGTDAPAAGTWPGVSIHGELELLVAAGLSNADALTAATAASARAFRLDDRGRIAVGLRADLLLVDGDPLTDITSTRQIVMIWKRGVAIRRTSRADTAY